MNLSSMLNARKKQQKPVRVGLIGAGKFGSMILSQARHIQGMIINICVKENDIINEGQKLIDINYDV